MKITFLGTGTSQGVPVIGCKCQTCRSEDIKDKRLRPSVMIEIEGKVFVIDTGPDFRQQMLKEKVRHVTAVLYTHEHRDHVAGMDDLRAFNYLSGKPAEIYAGEQVQESLKMQFHYVFLEKRYPGIPKVNFNTIDSQPFLIEGVEFIPIKVFHHKMPVLGFRVGDFTYITDANHIPSEEIQKITGSKILVLNSLRKMKHLSHFTLDEAISLIQEVKPQQGYLTHISHELGLHREVSAGLPDNIKLAYDGLSVES